MGKDGVDQPGVVEDGVARLRIAKQVNQRNLLLLRTAECSNDELKIRGREPCPTIRLDHRDLIISFLRAIRKRFGGVLI
jgi:hypothetical protein